MAVRLSALRDGRPPFTPRKIPGTHFCQRLSRPQGHIAAGRIRSIEKSNYLIGNRIRDLPAYSIVSQPTTCSPLKVNWSFGATRSKQSSACNLLHAGFLLEFTVWPWRWRRHVPPKRLLTFNRLQDVISQNTEGFSIINATPAYEYWKCVENRI
jgi:hypothetical protein